MYMTFRKLALAVAGAGLLTLQGCGGGGSGDAGASAPASVTVSGTAAAGLPLVGSVTVKDANGVTRTSAIGANGSYAVDVSGLSAPFVLRAEGTVGGRGYTIHSAASAADVNGTVNITPLTDLIVANIAGQLASNYFNGGNFAGLTRAELDAETASLKAKLLPVLLSLGVEAGIDLMRTAFTPLADALDKALDVLSVSIDPATNRATITNLVTQQAIVDDLATKAASETAATPMPATGMGTAIDDIPKIRKAVTDVAAMFATGLPSASALLPLLHDTSDAPFRDSDLNAAGFADALAADPSLVGATFTDIVISRIDYMTVSALGGGANVYPRAYVSFNVRNSQGAVIGAVKTMQVAKGLDGAWRLRGDNRRLNFYGQVHTVNYRNGSVQCINTGLEFGIVDPNSNNNGTGIAYVMVQGPGLPAGGLKYAPSADAGAAWTIQNVAGMDGRTDYVMSSSCEGSTSAGLTDAAIAAIPDEALYTVTPYDGAGVRTKLGDSSVADEERVFVYNEPIRGRPLTLAQARAVAFPVITTSAPLETYVGGSLTISATNMLPGGGDAYLVLVDGAGLSSEVDSVLTADAAGRSSVTLELAQQGSVSKRQVRVETRDPFGRSFMTVLDYFSPN